MVGVIAVVGEKGINGDDLNLRAQFLLRWSSSWTCKASKSLLTSLSSKSWL